jgi:hypothetical protein
MIPLVPQGNKALWQQAQREAQEQRRSNAWRLARYRELIGLAPVEDATATPGT